MKKWDTICQPPNACRKQRFKSEANFGLEVFFKSKWNKLINIKQFKLRRRVITRAIESQYFLYASGSYETKFKTKRCLTKVKVIKSRIFHVRWYFAYFQPNSIRKSLEHSLIIKWNCYIARSKLQTEPTWSPCKCWQRHMWTKLLGWAVIHCLKCMFLLPQSNKPTYIHVFNLLQTMLHITLCFELLILVGFQKNIGYHLLCLFSLIILFCTVVACSGTVCFFRWYNLVTETFRSFVSQMYQNSP